MTNYYRHMDIGFSSIMDTIFRDDLGDKILNRLDNIEERLEELEKLVDSICDSYKESDEECTSVPDENTITGIDRIKSCLGKWIIVTKWNGSTKEGVFHKLDIFGDEYCIRNCIHITDVNSCEHVILISDISLIYSLSFRSDKGYV